MLPEIELGGLSIKTFGLMVLVAYVLSLSLLGRRARELGLPQRWVNEVAVIALVGGLVGARVWALVQNREEFAAGSASWLSGQGLVWYGGLIGGALAAAAWAYWRGAPRLRGLDAFAPVLAADLALGRVGCQLSGDGDYGVPSSLPWAMGYPNGVVPTPPGVEVHPTPVYEALVLAAAAWWLWRHRDAYRPGVLFGIYLVIGGVERLLVEFVRRNEEVLAGLTAAQLTSVGLILGGAAMVLGLRGGQGHGPARAAPVSA